MEIASVKDNIDPAGSSLCIGSIHFWGTAVGFFFWETTCFKTIKASTDRQTPKTIVFIVEMALFNGLTSGLNIEV